LKLLLFAMLACTFPAAWAQTAEGPSEEAVEGNKDMPWMLANTAIFAIALGWFLAKYAPRFFNARSGDIQKAINDATGLKMDADLRYSEIDRKMATLADEVRKMREEGSREIEQVHAKMQRETQEQIDRIRKNASTEMEALRLEAARRVRRHTAQLALSLAERRIRDRFSGGEPHDLMRDFVRLVEQSKN
jgi:F-type H+-transporting ATPase subunit b